MIIGEHTITVDGKDVKILVGPNFTGGHIITFFGAVDGMMITGDYSDEKAIAAIEGFRWGNIHGQRIGKAILQNDFRKLLDLNR